MNLFNIASFLLLIIVVLLFYVPLGYLSYTNTRKRQVRRDAFTAVLTNLERNQDDQKCVPELLIMHKKLLERYAIARNSYKSTVDILEDLLYRTDSYSSGRSNTLTGMKCHKNLESAL